MDDGLPSSGLEVRQRRVTEESSFGHETRNQRKRQLHSPRTRYKGMKNFRLDFRFFIMIFKVTYNFPVSISDTGPHPHPSFSYDPVIPRISHAG